MSGVGVDAADRQRLTKYCGMCGAKPGESCIVVYGDGKEQPGDVRSLPHFYRSGDKPYAVLVKDEPDYERWFGVSLLPRPPITRLDVTTPQDIYRELGRRVSLARPSDSIIERAAYGSLLQWLEEPVNDEETDTMQEPPNHPANVSDAWELVRRFLEHDDRVCDGVCPLRSEAQALLNAERRRHEPAMTFMTTAEATAGLTALNVPIPPLAPPAATEKEPQDAD